MSVLVAEADATLLETGHEIGNDASRRVIEKCGFSFQRTIAEPLHNQPDTIRHEHIFIMTGHMLQSPEVFRPPGISS